MDTCVLRGKHRDYCPVRLLTLQMLFVSLFPRRLTVRGIAPLTRVHANSGHGVTLFLSGSIQCLLLFPSVV